VTDELDLAGPSADTGAEAPAGREPIYVFKSVAGFSAYLLRAMSFDMTASWEAEIDELIGHYPQKRSASLMLLHAVQERFGYISKDAMEWIAHRLDLQPINILELVTFYPMFRQHPVGRHQIKVCRTLSCALGGAQKIHEYFCRKQGLDPRVQGLQTTPDKKFSVEFVECLASCGTPPVVMCNDDFYESVSPQDADEILAKCK
jgi:NADH-quinone oxidoreductase subunit E